MPATHSDQRRSSIRTSRSGPFLQNPVETEKKPCAGPRNRPLFGATELNVSRPKERLSRALYAFAHAGLDRFHRASRAFLCGGILDAGKDLGPAPVARGLTASASIRDSQSRAGLIIRVPPTIRSAITPAAIASQLPTAAKAPVAAQLHDESASAYVAMRDEV